MPAPIKYLEKGLSVAANGAWHVFHAANRIKPNPAFIPKWSERPLLKSWEKSKPPLGWPRETDSLCPKCVREAREETSLDIEPVALAGHREVIMRDKDGQIERHFVILSFASRWLKGEPVLNSELDDARWVDPGELPAYKTTEGLAEIVTAAAALVAATA